MFAYFDTAFTADAFISIDRYRFFLLNLIDIYRTNIDTVATADTFFNIHFRFERHSNSSTMVVKKFSSFVCNPLTQDPSLCIRQTL